jgi:hypothetical protein
MNINISNINRYRDFSDCKKALSVALRWKGLQYLAAIEMHRP